MTAILSRADAHSLPLFFCKRNGLGGEVFVFLIALSVVNITHLFSLENAQIVTIRYISLQRITFRYMTGKVALPGAKRAYPFISSKS